MQILSNPGGKKRIQLKEGFHWGKRPEESDNQPIELQY